MQYDFDRQEVEIRYFTAQAEQPGDFGEFKAVRAPDGFWRFNASTRERGPFPLHMAATLLGFGDYR